MTGFNLQAVEEATKSLIASNIRVFNAFLFAQTERDHVMRLMQFMDLPENAVVLDAGCGIGETARLMSEVRPDLTFKLLNISQAQLEHCPDGMERLLSDFCDMPLPDTSVDVVMFHFSICHTSELDTVMREVRRVLKEGGSLFINDMSREYGDNTLMQAVLGAKAHVRSDLECAAKRAGLVMNDVYEHEPVVHRLRDLMDPALFSLIFRDVRPTTWRFTRQTIQDEIKSAFARHDRIGFQFSGGRDSTAALYLLRDYWPRMTIYHLDTGDQFPETVEVVRAVESETGPMVKIVTDVKGSREEFGTPSDLVPVDNSPIGRMLSGRPLKIVSRFECCARNLMLPMHKRLIDDGITLLIRGQRDDEYTRPPMRSGDVESGLEVLYPIQSWTGQQVSEYLQAGSHPLAPFYERGARRAPECMGCTAWWDEGRADYMKQYHPQAHSVYIRKMEEIRSEIGRQLSMLD